MTVDVLGQAKELLVGAFLARAIYGGEYIAPAFQVGGDGDAERNDDYRGYVESQGDWKLLGLSDLPTFNDRGGDALFTANGLYNGKVESLLSSSFDAQGLLAVEGGDTLVLTFRGTDGQDPAIEDGQTFTGQGLANHYDAFKSLINAAYDYLAAHPEITKVVVSGHSLGGAMVDVFALKDADRFRDLRPDGLTMVSLASSGIPDDLPVYLSGLDPDAAVIGHHTIEILPFVEIKIPYIKELLLPGDYISISNTEDRAHFPQNYPDFSEEPGLVPVGVLKSNLQFGGDLLFDLPNIENNDVQYDDPLENPFDFRGMGAEHNSSLLWANIHAFLTDPLHVAYRNHNLILGVADYTKVSDFNGDPISLFSGYVDLNNPADDNDRGSRALVGTDRADYILGLTGNDHLIGNGGHDLLSGGQGGDRLEGGEGRDRLNGGLGRDFMWGGGAADQFQFFSIAESRFGQRHDVIEDFSILDGDRMNVARIDADASLAGNQVFAFVGTGAFTDAGQIRVVQVDQGTLVRLNTDGAGGADMQVLLRGVDASTLTADSFIL